MALSSTIRLTTYAFVTLFVPILFLSMSGLVTSCQSFLPEVCNEVRIVATYFTLGFIAFRALRVLGKNGRTHIPKAEGAAGVDIVNDVVSKSPAHLDRIAFRNGAKTDNASRCCAIDVVAPMSRLPWEIVGEITCLLDLSTIASIAAASKMGLKKIWQSVDVWSMIAAERNLVLSLPDAPQGDAAREAFRRGWFRVDGKQLIEIGASALGYEGWIPVLGEAAHVLHGLMPNDGVSAVESLCKVAEKALQAHDPESKDAGAAADLFLDAARRRSELFSSPQIDRLEGAYNSALQLQELMEVTMQDHLDQLEVQGFYTDSPTPSPPFMDRNLDSMSASSLSLPGSPSSSPRNGPFRSLHMHDRLSLACEEDPPRQVHDMDMVFEDVHEMQRSQQLDLLLGALST